MTEEKLQTLEVRLPAAVIEALTAAAKQAGLDAPGLLAQVARRLAEAAGPDAPEGTAAALVSHVLSSGKSGEEVRALQKMRREGAESDREGLDEQVMHQARRLEEDSRRLSEILRQRLGEDWDRAEGKKA